MALLLFWRRTGPYGPAHRATALSQEVGVVVKSIVAAVLHEPARCGYYHGTQNGDDQ